MKTLPLRLLSALAVLTLTQCAWHEPRYEARYGGPAYPRPYYRDPIFGEGYFGYTGLKCLASSPLWARLHEVEVSECHPYAANNYDPLPMPPSDAIVVKSTQHTVGK